MADEMVHPQHIRVDSWRELNHRLLGRRPFTFRDNSSSLSHFLLCSTTAQMPSRPHPLRHAPAGLVGTLSQPISILCAPSSNPNPPVPYLGSPAQARQVDERMSDLLLRRGRSWLCETCGDPRRASKQELSIRKCWQSDRVQKTEPYTVIRGGIQ